MFIRYAAFHLQQLSAKRQRDSQTEQKSIESKDAKDSEKKEKRDTKSQEKETKDEKQKKEDKSAKKEESEKEVKVDKKEDDILSNENYSEIDTDVAKKIVESITDSICSGENKQESDCK